MPDDRKSLLRSLFYQFDPVGLPGGVDLREAGEVQEGIFVRVDLVVYLGYVAFVGAEHGRKGAEFYPAQEEFFGAMVLEHGIVYGGVGESLAEVGHPAGGSTIDELPFDYLLDPDPRLRVRQIHEGRGEAGDRDPVRLSIPILYQIAVSCGLLKEVAAVILLLRGVFTEERVYVGHEPDIPLLQALPQRTPVWVVIPVQLPVPPELGAEAGLPLPHPVL